MLRKKIHVCLFMFILIIASASCSNANKQDNKEQTDKQTLQSYIDDGIPSDGEFVAKYFDNYSNKLMYDVVYESVLNTVEVDVANLSVDFDELEDVKYYVQNLDDDDDIAFAIRVNILKRGAASIDDTSKAPKEELKAQKYAKKHAMGIWKTFQEEDGGEIDKKNNTDIMAKGRKLLRRIKAFFIKALDSVIVRWVLASVLTFSFLVSVFIKLIRRRNVMLFFGGDKSAGKTTLRKAIMDESIPEDELLDQAPSNATDQSRFIRDNKNRRLTIYSKNIDIPGDNNYEAINYLGRKRHRLFRKAVLTIVVAATKLNDNKQSIYDRDFVLEQKYSVEKFWASVIRSKVTRIRLVILFINKSDLYSDKKVLEDYFSDHIQIIKKACMASGTRFIYIVGSSVKRNGIGKILEELCKRR